jgi:soluble lytic murein transglycosylase-like protein
VNHHAKPIAGHKGAHKKKVSSTPFTLTSPSPGASKKPTTKLRGAGGVPTSSNPSFSFALPGAAPLGVPNFFIDSFRIPPFLLPIYQAAGIEYDVPWQVLAAINEIETDYGRNLSVSTAGAVGWMQFLPSTWKAYGVDATNSGYADPYNPVDAIFAAARYLHAAGASQSISQAIFGYNHASWYVQSVLLRAQLIGGMPSTLIGALTGLVEGHFPVAAPAKYADDAVERLATRRVTGSNAAVPVVSDPSSKGTSIYAKQGSPVIAVNDGKVVKLGENARWGRFVQLQDATGNIYTYADLGSVPTTYPVPRPVKITAAQIAKELKSAPAPTPTTAATAGQQAAALKAVKANKPTNITSVTSAPSVPVALPQTPTVTPLVKERLFADPSRAASYAAGGAQQLHTVAAPIQSFTNYFSDVLHLGKNQYTLKPLRAGAIVVAGTILGRIGAPSSTTASHVLFMIQPAGKGSPQIDPKPILDGWKLLEATAVYRAAGKDPFFGPNAKNPTIGQVLLMSKEQLTQRILIDPHVQIYACGRRDIQAGLVDRRILAALEFLAGSGLDPSISSLICGAPLTGPTGSSADIAAINGIPIIGHQGPGSITDITIRRLLTLQGQYKPNQIISTISYKGQPNTLSLPDHQNRIQITYTPLYGQNKKLSHQIASILKPGQWVQLINRINQIPEPIVPITTSQYAVRVGH